MFSIVIFHLNQLSTVDSPSFAHPLTPLLFQRTPTNNEIFRKFCFPKIPSRAVSFARCAGKMGKKVRGKNLPEKRKTEKSFIINNIFACCSNNENSCVTIKVHVSVKSFFMFSFPFQSYLHKKLLSSNILKVVSFFPLFGLELSTINCLS